MSDASWPPNRRPLSPRDAQHGAPAPAPRPGPERGDDAGGAFGTDAASAPRPAPAPAPRPGPERGDDAGGAFGTASAPRPAPAAPPRPGPGPLGGGGPAPAAGESGPGPGGAGGGVGEGPGVVETGHPGVDSALARLATAREVPAEARAGVYGEVHDLLRDTLAGLEERPGGPPTPLHVNR